METGDRIKLPVRNGTGLVLLSNVLHIGDLYWLRALDGVMRLTPSRGAGDVAERRGLISIGFDEYNPSEAPGHGSILHRLPPSRGALIIENN